MNPIRFVPEFNVDFFLDNVYLDESFLFNCHIWTLHRATERMLYFVRVGFDVDTNEPMIVTYEMPSDYPIDMRHIPRDGSEGVYIHFESGCENE